MDSDCDEKVGAVGMTDREQRMRDLIDGSPLAMFLCDRNGDWTCANGACGELLGVSAEQLMGTGWQSCVHPDDLARAVDQSARATQGADSLACEFRWLRADSSPLRVVCALKECREGYGDKGVMVGTLTEMPTHTLVDAQRLETLSVYADLYENSPDMLASIDPESGRVLKCNQTLCDVLGRNKDEVIGHSVTELLTPESAEYSRTRIIPLFRVTGQIEREELTLKIVDGSTRHVTLNATAARDANGKILYSRSVLRDVTDQEKSVAQLSASEQRLRSILNSEPECVKLIDPEGRLLDMNPAGLRSIEADSLEQVLHQPILSVIDPEHRDAFQRMHESVMAGATELLEFEIIGLKGTRRWMETHASPFRNQADEVIAQLAVTRDVTARKEAERLIEIENQLLSEVARGLPCGEALQRLVQFIEDQAGDVVASILLLDADGNRLREGASTRLSTAYVQAIDGIEIAEGAGSCGTAAFRRQPVFVNDIASDPLWEAYRELARTEDLHACWSTPILDSHGDLLGTFAIYRRQIGGPTSRHSVLIETAASLASILLGRQRDEYHRTESDRRFRTIFEQAAVGVAHVATASGRILKTNRRCCEILDASASDLWNQTWTARVHPDDHAMLAAQMRRLQQGKTREFSIEQRVSRSDGTLGWVNLTVSPMWAEGESPSTHIAVLEDIDSRKHAETQLRLTKFSVDSCSMAILWVHPDGTVFYANQATTEVFGFSSNELLGMKIGDFDQQFTDEMWPPFWRKLQQVQSLVFESQVEGKSGRKIPVEVNANLLRFEENEFVFASITDLSIRKDAEQERREHREMLAHVARLSTMGELVAGIAHEVNQPLYAISNFAMAASVSLENLQKQGLVDGSWCDELLDCHRGIRTSSQRASEIIRRLREFSRKDGQRRENLNINNVIRESIDLFAFKAKQSQIHVQTELEKRLPMVSADRIQCEQVLVNLLNNAYEVLGDRDQPREVVVRSLSVDGYVEIQVADNGPGVPEIERRKLFEPFYTTKPKGMGMGLAISRTIVDDHQGRLWISEYGGGGSVFHFRLPQSEVLIPASAES